jgi:hypothetical protein
MAIFDFLIFYLKAWYEGRLILKSNSALDRCCYIVALASVCFLLTIFIAFEYFSNRASSFKIPALLCIFFCLGLVFLFKYIYIEKDRFSSINPQDFSLVKSMGENRRITLAVIVSFLLLISPIIALFIFIPLSNSRS